jgi:hypothetical protein
MYVYLDESGDTGFAFRRGSRRYFVIALLLVEDPIPIHQAVHDIRLELELVYRRSHQDNLIQVADMIVGAIARTYEKGDGQYRHLICRRIQDEWVFPRDENK